jgi:hypothetical protein
MVTADLLGTALDCRDGFAALPTGMAEELRWPTKVIPKWRSPR